jgi:hypothetical protein
LVFSLPELAGQLLIILRDSVTKFFASGFFHESSFPKLLLIFLKIFNDTNGKFSHTGTAGVVDTCGNFTTSFNDPRGKSLEQYQTADTLK